MLIGRKMRDTHTSYLIKIQIALIVIGLVSAGLALANDATVVRASVTPGLWFDVLDTAKSIALDPSSSSAVIATGTLSVKANKAGWRIAVHSDDNSGKLKSGSTYLTNSLNISASGLTGGTGGSITPPLTTSTNQVLLTGIAHTQGPQTSTITYSQIPNWADAALPYGMTITFVGTSPT